MSKIYVLGDYGTDIYHVGRVRGLSAEAPIPVVDLTDEIPRPAMAANVVANLQALGAEVIGLWPGRYKNTSGPLAKKHRLVTTSGQQLARWDQDDYSHPYSKGELVALLDADAVVISDYGKGSISPEIIEVLQNFTRPIFVDTKADPRPWINSNAVLFPNREEYSHYRQSYDWCEKVVLKGSEEGLAYVEFGKVVITRPSVARDIHCVNGAGDTVISAFVLAVLDLCTLPQCLEIANAAAGNVVEQDFLHRTTTRQEIAERMNPFPQPPPAPKVSLLTIGGGCPDCQ